MNVRLILLVGVALFIGTMVALWFLGQAPEELSAWLSQVEVQPAPRRAQPAARPRLKRVGPCQA